MIFICTNLGSTKILEFKLEGIWVEKLSPKKGRQEKIDKRAHRILSLMVARLKMSPYAAFHFLSELCSAVINHGRKGSV